MLNIITYFKSPPKAHIIRHFFVWYFLINTFNGFSQAETQKVETEQTILYVFTGSDWCPNCIKFKRNVLVDSLFQIKLKELNIHIELLDFPQRKKQEADVVQHNKQKAEKFKFDGTFPTLILYSEKKDKFTKFNYHNENPEAFLQILSSLIKGLHD